LSYETGSGFPNHLIDIVISDTVLSLTMATLSAGFYELISVGRHFRALGATQFLTLCPVVK